MSMSPQKASADYPSASLFSPERWSFTLALAAGLCWSGALLLLFLANLNAETDPLAPQRLLFYALVLAAGLLTFVPIQYGMGLPSLAFEGVGGTALLFYTIAFVPPPTGWLLSLPDLPVYMLLILSLFWTSSAVVLPFVYAAGQRLFKHRARRRDFRRARRQSYEIGLLVACLAVLAALHVLSWVSLLLLVLILVIGELLLLSRIEVQRR
jgi:hypothetical protein